MMVRDFQSVVGREARAQFKEMTGGNLPDNLVACVGGGCNAIGLFSAFLDDAEVKMFGVEPAGTDLNVVGKHAATMTLGTPGTIHGFKCYLLQDEKGAPAAVNTVASGLDYPGVGPQHCFLKDSGRVSYETAGDAAPAAAFMALSRDQGIIPALESSHAVAYAMRSRRRLNGHHPGEPLRPRRQDVDYVVEHLAPRAACAQGARHARDRQSQRRGVSKNNRVRYGPPPRTTDGL